MDTAYAWHPGAVCVAPGWAIPVDLLPDELLSSWLVRVALANGCDPLALTGVVFPSRRVWSSDIDRYLPTEDQRVLAGRAGVKSVSIEQAMLAPVAQRITQRPLPLKGCWPWVLAVRPRNRRRFGGLQFCPSCLASDRRPFFRQHWRFAWHTICARHGCMLLDRCPHCRAPIEPHRLTVERLSVVCCPTCYGSLVEGGICTGGSADTLFLQGATDAALFAGSIEYEDECLRDHEWFSVLGVWLYLVRMAALGHSGSAARFVSYLGMSLPTIIDTKTWESFETASRAPFLEAVGKIVAMPLEDLIARLVDADVSRQRLFPKGVPSILSMKRIAQVIVDRPKPERKCAQSRCSKPSAIPKSKSSVERKMARLRILVQKLRKQE